MKAKNKGKKIAIVLSILVIVLLVLGGTSYALWNYTYEGENVNSIGSDSLFLEFLESNSDIISVMNAIPMTEEEGKTQGDVFEFAVTSKTAQDMNLRYILNIEKLQSPEGFTELSDDNVKIYLTDYNDNPLVGPIRVSELNNYELYDKIHKHNAVNEKLQDKYKLRIWIAQDIKGIDWTIQNKLNYSFKIGVGATQLEPKTVSVVVQNGVVEGEANKKVMPGENVSFNLKPNNTSDGAVVTCSSGKYELKNNTLTVSEVDKDTTCNVEYVTQSTVLYTDGTLIINELAPDRESNIETHGAVTNEYEAMSEGNSYVFSDLQPWSNERLSITSVEIGTEIAPISTANWFRNTHNMKQGDFSKLDTSQVTDMSGMFYEAGENATTFNIGDLSKWDTSRVTDMSWMFYYAGQNATTFNIGDLSNWDTSSVTDMSRMFSSAGQNATTFNIGDLSSWNTSNVTDMSSMFYYAGRSATTFNIGDLSSWNTSNVTNMSWMFNYAGRSATTFNIGDLSSWDTSKVTDMGRMFNYAGSSATTFNIGDLSSWDTSKVTDMYGMFSGAGANDTTFNIGDLSSWDISKVTYMGGMFSGAGQNATTFNIGDLSSWNTSNVTDMSSMFEYAGKKATTFNIGDLSSWDTSKVTDMDHMFDCAGYSATTFNIGDLSSWNTSNVTNMRWMFYYAGKKATTFNIGDLSSWDTSQVTDMSLMFNYAGESANWSLDCSKWNVNEVTSYNNFNSGVESKVTPPVWVN